jgi:hypothetical protein
LSRSTVVVIVLTEDGVVLGADHMREETSESDPDIQELKVGYYPKFAICGPDIVCSSTGLSFIEVDCSFETAPGVWAGGELKYHFYSWLPRIEDNDRISGQASPKKLAQMIWEKARSTFEPIECLLKTKKRHPFIEDDGLVMFLVVGYSQDSQLPQFFSVRVQIDRENMRLRYLRPDHVFPQNLEERLPAIFHTGDDKHVAAARKGFNPEASRLREILPKRRMRASVLMTDSPRSLQEAVAIVASLIDVESEFNPKIGGGSSIMVLRRSEPPQIIHIPEIQTNQ